VQTAEPLAAHVRALPGGERVAALLEGVWVVEARELTRVEVGLAVTREGHGFHPGRGELWFAWAAAEGVLMELDARRRGHAAERERLRVSSAEAASTAERCFAAERAARERVNRARASVALMPARVDPAEAAHLARLVRRDPGRCARRGGAIRGAAAR
jgi:hypothetical protein